MRLRTRLGWIVACGFAAGCGGGNGGGNNGTSSLVVSEAALFQTESVTFTLTLASPAKGAGMMVPLTSSNTSILSVPTFVQIDAGDRVATFIGLALNPGGPVIVIARTEDVIRPSVEVLVKNPPSIALVAVTTSADQMSTGLLTWNGTASDAKALNPAALTIYVPPASGITLGAPVLTGDASAFTIEATFAIAVDAAPEISSIHIDANGGFVGGTSDVSLAVTRIPRIASLTPAATTLDTTERRTFTVTLDQPARQGGETIALGSADLLRVSLPPMVVVSGGTLAQSVPVDGLTAGAGILLTATLADGNDTSLVAVADSTISVPVVVNGTGIQGQTIALTATGTGSSYVSVAPASFTLVPAMGSGLTVVSSTLTGDHTGWMLSASIEIAGSAPPGAASLAFDANGAVPGALRTLAFQVEESTRMVISEFTTLTLDTSGNLGERIEITNIGINPQAVNGWRILTSTSGPMTVRAATSPTNDTIALTLASGESAFGVPNPMDPLTIPAGAAFVYGDPGNAEQIGNDGDRLQLMSDAVTIRDEVDFQAGFVRDGAVPLGASDFPGNGTHSTQLDPASFDEMANDDGGNWCTSFRLADTHGAANQSCGTVVINELLYNPLGAANGNGDVFIEIAGNGGAPLGGVRIRPFDQAGVPIAASTITLAAGTRVPSDGIFVFADALGAVTNVANADQIAATFHPQVGPGDGIQLLAPLSVTVLDVVQYGAPGPAGGVLNDASAAVEGSPALPNTVEAVTIGRSPSSDDTNDNLADFRRNLVPSPGVPNP